MADTLYQFTNVIPAGTPIAAPAIFQMQLPNVAVEWIEIEDLTGGQASAGFYIASSNQQVIPFRSGVNPIWIPVSGNYKRWPITDLPNSGDWQMYGYNVGTFSHAVYVTFATSSLAPVPSTGITPTLIDAATLTS